MKPLSFIIISYNRSSDLLELLKNINQLDGAQQLLEEIIVVNNASADNYGLVRTFINDHPSLPFKYFDAPENHGVARGRNFALQRGKAPIVRSEEDTSAL